MSLSKKSILVMALSASALGGCANTPTVHGKASSASSTPMNQPKVKTVVEVNNGSGPSEKPVVAELKPVATSDSIKKIVFSSTDTSKVTTFTLMKGETYKSALYRWLSNEKFSNIGFLVNDDYDYRLKAVVDRNQMFSSNLTEAMNHLSAALEKVELTDEQTKRLKLHKFAPSPGEYFHLVPVGEHKAVVTTSALPVTMFEVQKGDVLTNYLRLGKHYGWNVSPDFYLAANYEVPFDFNIVTEAENVKSALNQLLLNYPGLSGGIYESNRQIFIESAEK